MARAERRVGCTNHCRNCGGHFSSVEAFDRHRQGDFDGPVPRHCVTPEDVELEDGSPALAIRSAEGFCNIAGPEVTGVEIWTMASGLERDVAERIGAHEGAGR